MTTLSQRATPRQAVVLPALFALAWLAAPAAWGQSCFAWGNGQCMDVIYGDIPQRTKTGDANLDRAVAICDAHMHETGNTDGTWRERSAAPGYEDCWKVIGKWSRSEAARRDAERKAKEDADRTWLAEYAKGLK